MDLAGIDRDHVARTRFDHAATAQRLLGALVDQSDAELLVRVAVKTVPRCGLDRLDAVNCGWEKS